MRDLMRTLVEQSGTLTFMDVFIRISASAAISMVVYISYWYTHLGTTYSKKFNVSLVTLTILTGTVMTVIGNNIALSLGMVGALSIVRFRTAVKDSRDATYIFWTIIIGICCGVGDYTVASVGSAIVFVVLLILGRVRNENRVLLIIKASRGQEESIESIVFHYFSKKALMKVKNTTVNSVEFIYEMTRSAYNISYKKHNSVTQELYSLEGMEYVNIVSQSDEISG